MIRRVAFKKALIGGVLGAVAWEITARGAIAAGIGVFDIVRTLGTMLLGENASPLAWWPLGLAMHAAVGGIWAIFYAYFFWSTFVRTPWLQGMLFSLVPAALAGLVMVPQLDVMRQHHAFGIFAKDLGWAGPAMIIAGHIIYGLVLGTIYVRPVGYRTGQPVKIHV